MSCKYNKLQAKYLSNYQALDRMHSLFLLEMWVLIPLCKENWCVNAWDGIWVETNQLDSHTKLQDQWWAILIWEKLWYDLKCQRFYFKLNFDPLPIVWSIKSKSSFHSYSENFRSNFLILGLWWELYLQRP